MIYTLIQKGCNTTTFLQSFYHEKKSLDARLSTFAVLAIDSFSTERRAPDKYVQ